MGDDLYAVPLDEFVKRRNELARELADAGEAEEAKRVKGLRKPTMTAWAINRVAHTDPESIEALVSAHDRLRSAVSAEDLRAASEARMAAIRRIVDAAEGVGDAVRKKMRSTLLAVATDPSAELALKEGRLDKELEPGGLGGFDVGPERAGMPAPAVQAESKKDRRARERAERLAAAAERRAAERRREADEASGSLAT